MLRQFHHAQTAGVPNPGKRSQLKMPIRNAIDSKHNSCANGHSQDRKGIFAGLQPGCMQHVLKAENAAIKETKQYRHQSADRYQIRPSPPGSIALSPCASSAALQGRQQQAVTDIPEHGTEE